MMRSVFALGSARRIALNLHAPREIAQRIKI
jgi:hypothetical protein